MHAAPMNGAQMHTAPMNGAPMHAQGAHPQGVPGAMPGRGPDARFARGAIRPHDFGGHAYRGRVAWEGGRWRHEVHNGRDGWWWDVGGVWYYYPQPIYPYPDPFVPPVVVAPAPAPGAQFWYFCRNPRGYYPYVSRCVVPWQAVKVSGTPTGFARYVSETCPLAVQPVLSAKL